MDRASNTVIDYSGIYSRYAEDPPHGGLAFTYHMYNQPCNAPAFHLSNPHLTTATQPPPAENPGNRYDTAYERTTVPKNPTKKSKESCNSDCEIPRPKILRKRHNTRCGSLTLPIEIRPELESHNKARDINQSTFDNMAKTKADFRSTDAQVAKCLKTAEVSSTVLPSAVLPISRAEPLFESVVSPEGTLSTHSPACMEDMAESQQTFPDSNPSSVTSGTTCSTVALSVSGPKLYGCAACPKRFRHFRTYEIHFRRHTFSPVCCLRCKMQFLNGIILRLHPCWRLQIPFVSFPSSRQQMADTDSAKKYICQECDYAAKFGKLVDLARHVRLKHPQIMSENVDCPECSTTLSDTSDTINYDAGDFSKCCCNMEGEQYECKDCGASFSSVGDLSKHREAMHAIIGGSCNISQSRNNNKSFICCYCQKAFGRKAGLQRHMNIHSDIKPQVCPYCDFTCREQANLQRHLDYHFSRRRFRCDLCGAAFHAKKTLETHHTYKHTDARNFVCLQCGMAFKTRNSLQRHVRTHSTEKEHKCAQCPMAFHRFYNLRRHVSMVHRDTGSFPPIRRLALLNPPPPPLQEGVKPQRGRGKRGDSGAKAQRDQWPQGMEHSPPENLNTLHTNYMEYSAALHVEPPFPYPEDKPYSQASRAEDMRAHQQCIPYQPFLPHIKGEHQFSVPPAVLLNSSAPASLFSAPGALSSAPAVLSSAPAVLSSSPTVLSNAPDVLSNVPAVVSSAPVVLSNASAVLSSSPAVSSSAPAVPSNAPAVLSNAPAVISSAPAVLSSDPAVISSDPAVSSSAPAVSSSAADMISTAPAVTYTPKHTETPSSIHNLKLYTPSPSPQSTCSTSEAAKKLPLSSTAAEMASPLSTPPLSLTPPHTPTEVAVRGSRGWKSEPQRAGGLLPHQQLDMDSTMSIDVTALFYPNGETSWLGY